MTMTELPLSVDDVKEIAKECTGCTTCEVRCPSDINIRLMFTYLRLNKYDKASNVLLDCVGCNLCAYACPNVLLGTSVMEAVRSKSMPLVPEWNKLWDMMKELTLKTFNPEGRDHEKRFDWYKDLKLKYKVSKEAKEAFGRVAVFMGCTNSYNDLKTAKSTFTTLKSLGVDAHIIKDEVCCGEIFFITGMEEGVEEIVGRNLEAVNKVNPDTLLTICSTCDLAWRETYPRFSKGSFNFRVMHYTELLSEALDKGLLKFRKNWNEVVTYHDPCHLSARPGKKLIDQPRKIIKAIPGVKLVEMLNHGKLTKCCGSILRSGRFSRVREVRAERMRQAKRTGANTLLTVCPFCKLNLLGGAREMRLKINVLQLPEFLANVLQ